METVQNGSEFKTPAPVTASPKKSAPPPGFKGQKSAPPPGFKGQTEKGQRSAPPPGFKGHEEVGQGDSSLTARGTKRSNDEESAEVPSTKKSKAGRSFYMSCGLRKPSFCIFEK